MEKGSSQAVVITWVKFGLSLLGTRVAILLVLLGILVPQPASSAQHTLRLSVTVRIDEQPCSLRPGDENISVDFGNITVNKSLLRAMRTESKPFQIHLDGCNPHMIKQAWVTFGGQGATEDDRLLALSDDSIAKGIAIGLEEGGEQLSLNRSSAPVLVSGGDNVLDFATYVQLLPSGQANLAPGPFNAYATFVISYN